MSRRTKLQGIFSDAVDELAAANIESEKPREPAGPVRSMAITLGRMEDETRALQQALIAGHHVQDLDTALIEESFVRDRMGELVLDEADPLVQSIADSGQEVPILVRPHPTNAARYQVAYGHRRLQAARILGIAVKAIVREISDDDLVVAQGIENSARSNLSYIERATFAFTLEQRGFKRPTIMRALTTDKTELSKLISVASAIPEEAILQIGRAQNTGRRKWIALADAFTINKNTDLKELFQSTVFAQADSDSRFEMVFSKLTRKALETPAPDIWTPKEGSGVTGAMRAEKKSFSIVLKDQEASAFGKFISSKLDSLYEEFKQRTGE